MPKRANLPNHKLLQGAAIADRGIMARARRGNEQLLRRANGIEIRFGQGEWSEIIFGSLEDENWHVEIRAECGQVYRHLRAFQAFAKEMVLAGGKRREPVADIGKGVIWCEEKPGQYVAAFDAARLISRCPFPLNAEIRERVIGKGTYPIEFLDGGLIVLGPCLLQHMLVI